MKKPRLETPEHQEKVLKSWDIKSVSAISFDSTYFVYFTDRRALLDTFFSSKSYTPIQFRVYDKHGKYVAAWEYCFGSLSKLNILQTDTVVDILHLPINRTINFDFDRIFFSGEKARFTTGKFDYTIIAFWASYYGKSAKRMLQEISEFIEKSKRKKIQFIVVNYNGVDR